ncbi:MAG: S53 family peptidase, partial [Mycobacteriales bacterium]
MRPSIFRHRAAAAFLALAVIATGTAGVVTAQASTSASLPTRLLAAGAFPGLSNATDLGPTAGKTQVLVGVVFAHTHTAAVARLEHQLYDKRSTLYHHFLTPGEFAARFGESAAAFGKVLSWAKRDGLKLAHANTTHDYFTVIGTAKQAERTFDVSLHNYRYRGQHFYANTTAPRVPAGLGVTGVIGLNDLLKGSIPSQPTRHTASPKPAQSLCLPVLCVGITTPQDLWSVYDAPTDNYGQGQSMAILGEGETDPVIKDLREFEQLNGLPPIPVTVVHTDGPDADYSDSSGDGEWDIDTQSSTGMAPEALGETLYFGSSLSDASILNDQAAWVQDPNGALQASMSIDECEENPVSSSTGIGLLGASVEYTQASEAQLAQAVVEGRTVFNSTGDTGSSCPILPLPVNYNGVVNDLYPV